MQSKEGLHTFEERELVAEIFDDPHAAEDLQDEVRSPIRPYICLLSLFVLKAHDTFLHWHQDQEKCKAGKT